MSQVWKSRIRTVLITTLLSLAAAECASRLFWYYQFDIPFFDPSRILYAFYPDMRQVDVVQPTHDDGYFNILFLGSSVLHPDFGIIEKAMDEELNAIASQTGHRKVRSFNLAVPSFTSRDDLIQYRAFDKSRFDLVIIYDGMNEVRANNVPPELFRDNYDHYFWYQIVNALSAYSNAHVALPYTLHYIGIVLWQRFHSDEYVPEAFPRSEWTKYGKDPRSVVPFQHNIESILDIASKRKDHVLLVTVAHHIPKDYSWDKLCKGKLDYASINVPVEVWGEPENVKATVALHNDVIRKLATAYPEVHFFDMDRNLPKGHRCFNDPCHLTTEGCILFANMLDKLIVEHW